jgi:cyclopropane-fatty-acyl-phospholipid synthase
MTTPDGGAAAAILNDRTMPGASATPIRLDRTNYRNVVRSLPLFFQLGCEMASRMRRGALRFQLPDGRLLEFFGDETPAVGLIIVNDYAFARRSVLGGDIGFFESFADGQWDSPNVADVLHVFALNADHVADAFTAAPLRHAIERIRHALNRNTRRGSRRNIEAHYDLGNAFYEKWLDETMTYSSARFSRPDEDLGAAQRNKYHEIAKAIGLQPGDRVLEIGSGWGGFAEIAARDFGADVTGLTLSPAQLEFASTRIAKHGISDRARFKLQDYRDATGAYDKIVSIEMFEAVGREYWPVYFRKLATLLRPGGVAGLQVITIDDRFFDDYSRTTDFIQRYVFPGGMLPSPERLKQEFSRAGLSLQAEASFGADYAVTLQEWRRRFVSAWQDIRPLGFDERFGKLWRFYLSYCEAGFRAGTTNVSQFAIQRS